MAIIQSGAGADLLTVDPAPKAARVILYGADGQPIAGARQPGLFYRAATLSIAGNAAAQNLCSIENPVGSGKTIYVKKVNLSGVVSLAATVKFYYRVGRTTALPTGATVTAQKLRTSGADPVAVVRQSPVATPAAGDLWAASPGIMLVASSQPTGQFVSPVLEAFSDLDENGDLVLAPGEGMLVRAEPNGTAWSHSVNLYWSEL